MNDSNQHYLKQLTQPILPAGPAPDSVKTNAEHWQITCWDLAKANRQFCLRGYRKPHQTFVEELAFTYQYDLEMAGKKVVFHPNATPNQARP
jgi:hypothetical protein